MIAAIPAPPEPLVVVATVLVGLPITLALVGIAASALEGSRKARAALVAVLVSGLLVLVWDAIAHSAERTLTFTLPLTTAKANASGQIVDCSGGAPLKHLAGWRLFAQVQSRTWADSQGVMLADSAAWSRLWSRSALEALPRQIRSASTKHLPNNGAGSRVTVQAPDSLDGMPVISYFVELFNDSLRRSCWSNRKEFP